MSMFSKVIEYEDYKKDGVTVGELIRVLRERGYTAHKTGKALTQYLRANTRGDSRIRVVLAGNVQKVRGVRFREGVPCPAHSFLESSTKC
jgi:hypothetical protein